MQGFNRRHCSRPIHLAALLALLLATFVSIIGPATSARAFTQNPATVFINEFHYDNAGTDSGEFIEVAGPAGTDLTGWSIVLYNGNGGATYTPLLTLSGTLPNQSNGYGTVSVAATGLQNGAPDGVALVNNGTVVQFLSYEGAFTAVGGPANGMASTDIGIIQNGTEPVGSSLNLVGTGATYQDFTWAVTTTATPGAINGGQTFTGGPPPSTTIDLSTYTRIGRYNLPVPARTTAPAGSLLALEVSAVTYNPETDTLFVLGDEGTSVVQISKNGQLIDSMTLTAGDFADPEGLTHVSGSQFALVEERLRQVNLFTYVAGGTLARADVQTVDLGTDIGNIGLEGVSFDPQSGGYILVKETSPQGIFQTGIDFGAGTATNGSPSTVDSTNLFDPALAGLTDIADVFALSNLPASLTDDNLLVLSQEDGKIVNIDRSGNIANALTITGDSDNPLTVAGQGFEGVTMDANGLLYIVGEQAGGDGNHPQLWVYAPAAYSYTNAAPVEVSLSGTPISLPENTSTAAAIKVGTIVVSDDALGTNTLSLSGADAAAFEIVGSGLFLKAGTALDFETKPSYVVTVNVDDASLGGSPDASRAFTLAITNIAEAAPVIVSEVAPWSSGNSPGVGADWFEVTNTSASAVDITGWKMDDSSASFANAVALNGVTSLAPGQSAIFLEGDATRVTAFVNTWFGGTAPTGVLFGTYSGSGVGLGTGGDAVNLFDAGGALVTGVTFGASPAASPFATFDNAAGDTSVTALSVVGVNGAFSVVDGVVTLIGSPGAIENVTPGQALPLSEGFDSCPLTGWQIVSVDADTANTWTCSAQFSNAEGNGFGDTAAANEWLITPALNMDAQGGDTLSFRSQTSFTDSGVAYPQLSVKYSTTYSGSGDPTAATWTDLTGITFSPENSGAWTDSGVINLASISGSRVYFAFQYRSSGTGSGTAARWRLDTVNFAVDTAGPTVSSLTPADGAAGVAVDQNLLVTFNETVQKGTGNITIHQASDNAVVQTIDVTGANVTVNGAQVTINPATDLATDTGYYVNIAAGAFQDTAGNTFTGIADATTWNFTTSAPALTLISTIQGSGSAVTGAGPFTVEAIVVGDYQTQGSGQLRGFFIQEEDVDADASSATSEGIFVFCSSCTTPVAVGDKVRVTAGASDFNGMSQLSATTAGSVTVLSSGNPRPTSATVTLPVPGVPTGDLAAATAVINAYFEPFEGMLVTFPSTLSVSEYFELARYGQVILNAGGRPRQFTDANVPSASGYTDHQIDLDSRTIILDDTDNRENRPIDTPNTNYYHPVPGLSTSNYFRGGDTISNLTGVLHWSFAGGSSPNAWRIRPVTEAFNYAFTPANPRPAAPSVGGSLKVASFNVLNYFLTIDTTSSSSSGACGASGTLDCRGADNAQELERQRAKLTQALLGLDADIVGLIEMENTSGVNPTLQIVDDLNAVLGPGTYTYIDTGVIGSDAIRVGIIYKPGKATPVGNYAILDSSVDPNFIDTRNRPALAQTFEEVASTARFTVVVNHLKSKGSSCGAGDDDTTTGQGNCNGTRTLAAQALASWLANDPTGSGDPDVLIIGDLNSYAKEDPITTLQNGGFTNLVAQFGGADAYSYVFDGQLGYLDHALANASLTPQVTGVAEWHINADEIPLFDYNDTTRDTGESTFEEESDTLPLYAPDAFRTSDHDPVVIGLSLTTPNTAPVADAQSVTTDEGTAVAITLTGSDAENSSLTYSVVGQPAHGTLSGAAPNLTYTPNASYAGTDSFTFTVNDGALDSNVATVSIIVRAATTTSFTTSANPASTGQPIIFTANVGAVAQGVGTPDGTVTFKNGGEPIAGCANLALTNGAAQCSTSFAAAGNYTISVDYSGSASFIASASAPGLQVVKVGSTTTVSSSLNPSFYGQRVTFTANVSAAAGPRLTGSVTFLDGTAVLATRNLSNGQASFTTWVLSPGSHTITAVYSGNANIGGSVSPSITQVVTQAVTSTSLAASVNPAVFGQAVKLTATVATVSGVGTATGTVTFYDGATIVGSASLSGGKANLTVKLPVGSHSISAVYAGSTNFAGSSSASLALVVNQAATTTTLRSSRNPAPAGRSVTFTATLRVVSPGAGTPTGSVTFYDGATPLATVALIGNKATFTTSTLTSGTHPITAVYSGDASYATSTSNSVSQTIN